MGIPVIGLGCGGHARVLIEALRLEGKYEPVGMLDRDDGLRGEAILGVQILGSDDLLPTMAQDVGFFFIGVGSIGSTAHRAHLYQRALAAGLQPVSIIHPCAVISPSAQLGRGIAVLANAVINAAARLGENVIVNTGSIVEHDSLVGDHVHIATGARLCGGVSIGNLAHIGAGSTILQGIKIGEQSIIGAGAVVVRDVPPSVVAVGVPARIRRSSVQDPV